jgi:drug/metabolite transporter (DMT)-like permease
MVAAVPPSATLLISAAACWGLGTVLSKRALGGFDASLLLPFQLACSAALLGVFILARRIPVRDMDRLVSIAALGVLNPGIAYALGLTALARIGASVSVIVWATEPVWIVLLAFAFLHERLTLRGVLCLASAMAGVALIVGSPSGAGSLAGVGLTLVAVLACALYSILLRRLDVIDATVPIVFIQQVSALAFAMVILLSTLSSGRRGDLHASTAEWVSAVVAGGLYYGVAFVLYVTGLRRTSAAAAGSFLTLIPVFGIVFSWLLLGEAVGLRQLAGSIVVITSMGVLAAGGRSETPAVSRCVEPSWRRGRSRASRP